MWRYFAQPAKLNQYIRNIPQRYLAEAGEKKYFLMIFCPTNRTQPGEKKYSSTIARNIEQVQLKCQDITSQASFSETLTKVTTAQHLFTLALHMSYCPKSSFRPNMVSPKSKTIEKAF